MKEKTYGGDGNPYRTQPIVDNYTVKYDGGYVEIAQMREDCEGRRNAKVVRIPVNIFERIYEDMKGIGQATENLHDGPFEGKNHPLKNGPEWIR